MFLSIIIPTYNSTRLNKLLESICTQSLHKDEFEVLIIDDCSSDKSFLSELNVFHSQLNIRIIENEKNLKQGLTRQVGINNAKGDWITFIDHDDILLPNSLYQVKAEIGNTKCQYLFDTNMIISISENYFDYLTPSYKGPYGIQNNSGCLHGKFFNRLFLIKNGITFHNTIFGNEDTYFLTVVFGIIAHMELKNPNINYKVYLPIITYVWFLWPDSLSHTKINNISYIEYTFNDYMQACFDGWLFLHNLYHDFDLAVGKLLSLLMYGYWLYEGFDYANYNPHLPHHDTLDNLLILKKYQEKIFKILHIKDYKHFIEIMHCNPQLYGDSFVLALKDHGRNIIPKYSLEERFSQLEELPSQLTEEDNQQINNIIFFNIHNIIL